jgi:hypothetical protein
VQPFTIQCTTCRRSLRVASPAAIGQILSCPKCSGFILIEAPPGWDVTPSANDPTISSMGVAIVPASNSSVIVAPASASPAKPAPSAAPKIVVAAAAVVVAAPKPAIIPEQIAGLPTAIVPGEWKDPPTDFLPGGDAKPHSTVASNPIAGDAIARHEVPVANAWPRWFLPGVGATVAVGVLAVVLRLMLHHDSAPPTVPTPAEVAAAPESNVAHSADPINATTNKPVVDEPANNAVAATDAPPANPPAPAATPDALPATAGTSDNPAATPEIAQTPTTKQPVPAQSPASAPAANPPATNTQIASINPPALPAPPPPAGQAPNVAAAPDAVLANESIDNAAANENGVDAQAPAANRRPFGNQTVPRTLQRVPARVLNAKARMLETLPAFSVKNMSLVDFCALFSELSTVPVSIDVDALQEMGRVPSLPVQVNVTSATFSDVLKAALDPVKLGLRDDGGQLIVGYAPQQTPRAANYSIADLATDNQQLAALAALVQKFVAPQSWKQNGGEGTLAIANGAFSIQQTDSVHNQLIVFCEKLRIARGLPQKSKFDPARFVLMTRTDKGRALLSRPVSINFGAPEELGEIVKWLHGTTGATFLIDHVALADEETSAQSECTVVAANKPLSGVLDDLLRSADLTWRVIDENTIEITTRLAAASRSEIEFHPVPGSITNASAAETLIAQIKLRVEPSTWTTQPGDATLQFDERSHSLIVRAPQRVQALVEQFLRSGATK